VVGCRSNPENAGTSAASPQPSEARRPNRLELLKKLEILRRFAVFEELPDFSTSQSRKDFE
jgi:hypothetical protein